MSQTDFDSKKVASRIRFLISGLRMTQAAFARRLGIDPANLCRALTGQSSLNMSLVNRVVADIGVSKEWLLTGEGVAYSKGAQLPAEFTSDTMPVALLNAPVGVPVYDIDVTAGCRELSLELTDERIIGRINLPSLSDDAVIVRVSGDSMDPKVKNGSYVAIRPIRDTAYIHWGGIYVIILDDYRMVKFIRRNDDKNLVTLHSANPDYDDMEVRREDIRRLYLVEAVISCDMLD